MSPASSRAGISIHTDSRVEVKQHFRQLEERLAQESRDNVFRSINIVDEMCVVFVFVFVFVSIVFLFFFDVSFRFAVSMGSFMFSFSTSSSASTCVPFETGTR